MSRRLFEQIGPENYEKLVEFFDPDITKVAKFLYKKQNSHPFKKLPNTPEKIITCEKLCKECGIDIGTLERKLNNHVSEWVFEIYNCSLNGVAYEGIGLNLTGISYLEGKYPNIHGETFPKPESLDDKKPQNLQYW